MWLTYSCRAIDETAGRYTALDSHGLEAVERMTGGDGSAGSPFRLEVTVRNAGSRRWRGVVRLDLPIAQAMPRFLLPGFMVGWNRGEAPMGRMARFPRMRDVAEPQLPASSWWMVRGDRLANPCALAFADGRVRGVAASPLLSPTVEAGGAKADCGKDVRYAGFTCAFGASVGVTLGYENAPWLFVSASDARPREPLNDWNTVALEAGETLVVTVWLFDYPAEDERGFSPAVEATYRLFHQPARDGATADEAVAELAHAVDADTWLDQRHMYAGFVFDGTGTTPAGVRELGSISWTNGLAAASPMLAAALRLGDEGMRAHALDCIQRIVDDSWNPVTGLPYTAVDGSVWSNRGWWFDHQIAPGHSSYLVGQALHYILWSYELERRLRDVTHDDWLAFVERALPAVQAGRNGEGEYPYVYSEMSGAGLDYDSFAGAWCLAAVAHHIALTGDRSRLEETLASERHYHDRYVRRMECYGAPLDTDKAVDSEGILAYIKACRYLHEATGDGMLLDHMSDAIRYESTFRFCWNSPLDVPPLNKVGWTSCGGSVTSTCNPHIHPMSSAIIGDMAYYCARRDDDYVRSRMEDAVRWSCQTYNRCDGEYDYGRAGWMSERFCYSQGLLTERYRDGAPASTWFAIMPWAIGSILDGLAGDWWDLIHRQD